MGTQQLILAAIASVIAGLVLLTMFAVQEKSQIAAVDAIQYRTSKSNMLSTVEILERDFSNYGANLHRVGTGYIGERLHPNVINDNFFYDSTAVTDGMRYELEFLSQPDSLQPFGLIRYEWEPSGAVVTLDNGTDRHLYRLERYFDGNLTFTNERLTDLKLDVLPDTTLMPAIVNPVDIRLFKVRVRGVSPLGKAETIEETRFDATYRPVAMTMYN